MRITALETTEITIWKIIKSTFQPIKVNPVTFKVINLIFWYRAFIYNLVIYTKNNFWESKLRIFVSYLYTIVAYILLRIDLRTLQVWGNQATIELYSNTNESASFLSKTKERKKEVGQNGKEQMLATVCGAELQDLLPTGKAVKRLKITQYPPKYLISKTQKLKVTKTPRTQVKFQIRKEASFLL